jgi:CRISPR-associated protein Csb3
MSFELNIERINPNHYMAAVGLHMVADVLDPGATLHFSPTKLIISGAPTLRDVLGWLKAQGVVSTVASENTVKAPKPKKAPAPKIEGEADDSENGTKSAPLRIGSLVVSWQENRPRLRPWGGSMSVAQMTRKMLLDLQADDLDPLYTLIPGAKPLPPGFDIGRGAVAQVQDLGYRTGDAEFKVRSTMELLCLLGLQRFNPVAETDTKEKGAYRFHVWKDPILISLVPAASCGKLAGVGYLGAYIFRTFQVTDKSGYAFTSANPV